MCASLCCTPERLDGPKVTQPCYACRSCGTAALHAPSAGAPFEAPLDRLQPNRALMSVIASAQQDPSLSFEKPSSCFVFLRTPEATLGSGGSATVYRGTICLLLLAFNLPASFHGALPRAAVVRKCSMLAGLQVCHVWLHAGRLQDSSGTEDVAVKVISSCKGPANSNCSRPNRKLPSCALCRDARRVCGRSQGLPHGVWIRASHCDGTRQTCPCTPGYNRCADGRLALRDLGVHRSLVRKIMLLGLRHRSIVCAD